jgi:Domain of unknown function (DUF4160)
MPRLSAFYGIVIGMFYRDHAPPHFHARYADSEAKIDISSLELIDGSLPPRAARLVREWAELHRAELAADWDLAVKRLPLNPIEPLV